MSQDTSYGKIVHIVPQKGFGFIQSDEHEQNLFFHAKDIRNSRIELLKVGDEVSFGCIIESSKGLSCSNVKLIKE